MRPHAHAHKVLPLRVYLMVGAALLVLTAVTIWASLQDYGEWNIVVALTIASVKALLVAFFFMHLFYDNKFYFFVFILGVLFLVIFIGFTMIDTLRRGDLYREVASPIIEKAIIYRGDVDSLGAPADTAGGASPGPETVPKGHE